MDRADPKRMKLIARFRRLVYSLDLDLSIVFSTLRDIRPDLDTCVLLNIHPREEEEDEEEKEEEEEEELEALSGLFGIRR